MFGDVEPNQFLYHYTKAAIVVNKILPELRLRFSAFAQANDPRESKDFRFSMTIKDEALAKPPWGGVDFLGEAQRKFNHGVKGTVRLLCFGADTVPPLATPNEVYGRGFSHSRMWAQYAERHAGVCLILDREAIGREIGESLGTKYKLYCGRVQYRTWYDPRDFQFSLDGLLKCGYAECISELISQHHAGLWFTKTVDWEQEHEYRYVLVKPPSDVDDQIYVSIEHSLKAVVLGADIKPRNRVRVIKYGKQLGIDVAQMDWYNGHPSVLPVFIPPGPDAPAQPLP